MELHSGISNAPCRDPQIPFSCCNLAWCRSRLVWEDVHGTHASRSGVSTQGSGVTIEGLLLFPVEAITTPVAETKAATEKDDDCDVDFFGDETKEEKRLLEIVQ